MKNGRHKGELITRVPVHYLKWMVGAAHTDSDRARFELTRRGTVTPELEISGHAINRASFRCLNIWKDDRKDDEGLHSWLVRICGEALKKGEGSIRFHNGMKLVFAFDNEWPILKSIMPDKGGAGMTHNPFQVLVANAATEGVERHEYEFTDEEMQWDRK